MSLTPPIKPGDWDGIRRAIQKIARSNSFPTYANVIIDGLTASRLLSSDGDKKLTSVADLTSWIAGTSNQITIADDSDGTITLSTPQDIHTGANPTFATLKSTGGRIKSRTTVTGSPYTVLATDEHISVTTASTAITLNLPAIVNGTIYHIKDQDENSSGENITVSPDGSDTIENAASLVISADGTCITIIGNSTTNNWEIQ